ncbi:GH36-type glycosyl hydrolase domain-containing protein [Thioclava nitratireducens]|uniref:GH36-type glycosyl hydrolase domain-containing protein n=1 Tax=Thioclava nitratireducens TaxID=1915078 RepID=UPI002480A631|nr:glucoamylase family protein [Thioclava nitratireducens]WGT51329.1 glucoamylase family protein [Thioclava nitratireducens]
MIEAPDREAGAGPEELLDHAAESLSHHLEICAGAPRSAPVWAELDAIPKWLVRAQRSSIHPPPAATKAAEWLLDNEYHVRRAVRQVQADMPPEFYRRLPSLATPECRGLPRIFLAAHGFLASAHMQVNIVAAERFLAAFQRGAALTIAELWAFPAMLRLACLETIVVAFSELIEEIDPPFRATPGAAYGEAHDPTEAVSRAIMALSAISRVPWEEVFEATNRVEAILREDPAGIYAAMDFDTRDSYRKAVEELSVGSDWSETRVADQAILLATSHAGASRANHVGWWLAGDGRRQLEQLVGFRARPAAAWRRWVLAHAGASYAVALIAMGTVAMTVPLVMLAVNNASVTASIVAALLSLMPASIIAVTVVNWLVTQTIPPRTLPKLDFRDGLPKGCETAVVLPVIIAAQDEVSRLIAQLERHWLTNPDPLLRYVILSDLADAASETLSSDAGVEDALSEGIRKLNGRYGPGHPFILMHRRRRWNPAEGVWMGWERKRGKLEEFNAFLHGDAVSAFALTEGNTGALGVVRFVVTLDADTIAPPGTIHRLIGTLAHPLNRVEFDPTGERVISGYTFIQPRIEISPEAGSASLFARLYTGDTAIDIYSRAVSDVYQDLFGEGVFTGKGAYDAAAFSQSLRGRVPENAILSHDLFEGLHGRAALASDIVFYENFPGNYPEFTRRWHRWIRGDWQLLPWLRRTVPGRGEKQLKNPLSPLDRWKIIDNLRRSLIPPVLVLLALIGWLLVPSDAFVWSVLTVVAPGVYLVTDSIAGFIRGRRRGVVRERTRQFLDHARRWTLAVVFMAHEAFVSLDAICRVLWRMMVSRRRMLEWTSSAHVATADSADRRRAWQEMAGAPILALAMAATLMAFAPEALPGAAPLLLLWLISPEIAQLIARPLHRPEESLSCDDQRFLRHLARRTWLYFETYAGPEDNWLPPDNYQTEPHEEIAHRSSPTNVGMLLLSTLSAFDLGHSGLPALVARAANVLATLERLERYHGHILNWFDTRTLEPLEPRYVSTVDSGNLAVALVTLAEGCREAAQGPPVSSVSWDGLADSFGLLRDALAAMPSQPSAPLLARLDDLIAEAARVRDRPEDWAASAGAMRDTGLPALSAELPAAIKAAPATDSREIHLWLERSIHHVNSFIRDLETLCPWTPLVVAPPPGQEALAAQLADVLPPDLRLEGTETAIETARGLIGDREADPWHDTLRAAFTQGLAARSALRDSLTVSAEHAHRLALAMEFGLLYDRETRTFFIGYNLSQDQLDQHRYDLLASEARLASYFAIAKGDVPVEHWFHLGRPLAHPGRDLTVLSWNGSMFEYLMPALLLRSGPGRLLGQSEAAAVAVQKRYGERLGLPWGVSEAAFATRDASHRYQYRAFGVPGLGLKRGLDEDYVVSPYASALALAVVPATAVANLRRLDAMGMQGRYGFYDAADFTAERSPSARFTPVQTFMAHHQGMLLSAIDNALTGDSLVRRFNRDPRIAAMEMLLQERVPWEYVPEPLPDAGPPPLPELERRAVPPLDGWPAPDTGAPQLHVIGNGRLSSWISDGGDSTLWWQGQSLTLWSGDLGRAARAGLFLRDAENGMIWDFRRRSSQAVDITFYPDRASFHLHKNEIAATQEIVTVQADDVELRRVTLVNESQSTREIEVSSYSEVALASFASHERHPAFSKLFVQSEPLVGLDALLFTRRPRRPSDRPPVMLQRLLTGSDAVQFGGFDSDRRAILGRYGSSEPLDWLQRPPEATSGWTLDPASALRATARLAPGARVQLAFMTVAAGSRETAIEIASRYSGGDALDWAFEDTKRSIAIEADQLGASGADLRAAQAVAADLVRPPVKRAESLAGFLPGQHDLWGLGLSGDLPIVLVRVDDADHAALLPAVVRAHRWWHRHGLRADLVILSTGASSYEEPINARLRDALRDAGLAEGLGGDGGVHLHSADRIATSQRRALEELAQVVLDGAAETLTEALQSVEELRDKSPLFTPDGQPERETHPPRAPAQVLRFENGCGGFSEDGDAYVIHLDASRVPPTPWCNVLANDYFGTIVSEAGLGFTWSLNAGEHRLTPWSNDPVTDAQGEALYLRDEETARIWTPTPLPAGHEAPCEVTHRAGSTEWTRTSQGLEQQLTVFVPPEASVKLAHLRLRNTTDRPRRITATYVAEWQLGGLPSASRPHVACAYRAASRALIARNGWQSEFAARVAFLTASHPAHSLTCDRATFYGPENDATNPEGLRRWSLGGKCDAIRDACAAYQVHLDIAPGGSEEVVFVLGDGANIEDAEALAVKWADVGRAAQALEATLATWHQRLGAVTVETPDPAFDLMVNRWLPYQALSSRIMARAGFNQAGGGIGFRDQLQDMMAFLFSEPARVRAHILDCAGHQFEEGDVLHWWHPPEGRGVRTRCSDDMLWLVYATHRYVRSTGDVGILDEEVPFLTAPPLTEDEEDRYAAFPRSAEALPLFEHCRRALIHGVTSGQHGLPLIGAGDWNDGMDRVGYHGRGESVWLAWFASHCAEGFADLSRRGGHEDQVEHWERRARELKQAADNAAWDGAWYMRAFDDDGQPWGSQECDECRIDSIAQSWSVLAGGPDRDRGRQAMRSASEWLVDRELRLVRLLTPPFDRTPRDPGYIRAYPPGVRENGGQYTHAATWLGMAQAKLGNGEEAYRIFDLINPIRRSASREDAERYRAEPYVMPADVGGAAPFEGRAGWTWYTGAAAWSWRLGVEAILGLELVGGALHIAPCLPKGWGRFRARLRGPAGAISLRIDDPEGLGTGAVEITVDGHAHSSATVEFPTDGATVEVTARLRVEPAKGRPPACDL